MLILCIVKSWHRCQNVDDGEGDKNINIRQAGIECPGEGELDMLRWLWGGDLDTGKSGLSNFPSLPCPPPHSPQPQCTNIKTILAAVIHKQLTQIHKRHLTLNRDQGDPCHNPETPLV